MVERLFKHLVARRPGAVDIDDQLHIIISGECGDITRIPCSRARLRRLTTLISLFLFVPPLVFGAALFAAIDTGILSFYQQGSGCGLVAERGADTVEEGADDDTLGRTTLFLPETGDGDEEESLSTLPLDEKDGMPEDTPSEFAQEKPEKSGKREGGEKTAKKSAPLTEKERLQEEIERLKIEISALEEENQEQLRRFDQERREGFGAHIEELDKRRQKLDSLLQAVGIIVPRHKKVKIKSSAGVGGPFHELSPLERRQEDLIAWVDDYIHRLDKVPVGRPSSGQLSSPFGRRRDPFNGRTAYHDGLDFRAKIGTPIYAAADGVAVKAHSMRGYGKVVEIRHDKTYSTLYAHMNRITVKKGQKIKRGDKIGEVGNTGRSTGPHLHYEVHKNGIAVNPARFVKAAGLIKKRER